MILDRQSQVSAAQAVTASAYSTDTIDLGVARDIGAGNDLKWAITVDESFATATSVEIQVVSSANANLSSHNVLASTGAIVIAQLTAGRSPIIIDMPRSLLTSLPRGERYIGLRYVIGGTNATAGKFTASLVFDAQDIRKGDYASGFSIS